MINKLLEEFKNSIQTISPLFLVDILSLFSFLFSSILLIIGSTLFAFGADLSMIVIGNKIGKDLVKSKRLKTILIISFIIVAFITIAEPDLIVLAEQITSINSTALILIISIGVGLCLLIKATCLSSPITDVIGLDIYD